MAVQVDKDTGKVEVLKVIAAHNVGKAIFRAGIEGQIHGGAAMRTEENHYLATPPDIARTLPRRAQELIGYAAHDALLQGGGYLGALDLRDPVEMLADGSL